MNQVKAEEMRCYVAKGPCGHYYWCAVDMPDLRTQTAKDIAKILRREGHVVERKTVQWVRDGGLDGTDKCKKGECGAANPLAQGAEK